MLCGRSQTRISQTSERMHQSICTFLGVVPITNQCAMLLLFLHGGPAAGWRSRMVCAEKTRHMSLRERGKRTLRLPKRTSYLPSRSEPCRSKRGGSRSRHQASGR